MEVLEQVDHPVLDQAVHLEPPVRTVQAVLPVKQVVRVRAVLLDQAEPQEVLVQVQLAELLLGESQTLC
jgi:hypothetical protein